MASPTGELGFLFLDGLEVINEARAVGYLNRNLGPLELVVTSGCPCSVLSREIGVPTGGFVSPSADPAPWYSAADPESAEFLGILVSGMNWLDPPTERDVTTRGSSAQGGALGPLRMGPREIKVSGWLIASSDDGLFWGRSWLSSKIAACGACSTSWARMRGACPPDNGSDDTRGEFRAYDVGVTEGLVIGEPADGLGCPYAVSFEFTLVAGTPWLYGALATCLDEVVLNPSLGAFLLDTFTAYGATWTTDAGAAPVVTGAGLQPGSTATARYRRNDRTMLDGAVTWKVTTGAVVAGFGVDVFMRAPSSAETFLAASWLPTGLVLRKVVAGVSTTLATPGGPAVVPATATTYWVRVGLDRHKMRGEVWNADPSLLTTTIANLLVASEHYLTDADYTLFNVAGFGGLRTLVDATDERYDDFEFDPALNFDVWWGAVWPDALCCTATPALGGFSYNVTLKAGATFQLNGAIVWVWTNNPVKPLTTLTTTTTRVTNPGTGQALATIRNLPVNYTLVLDGALRTLTAIDASGNQTDGSAYLAVDGQYGAAGIWPSADGCGTPIEACAIAETYAGAAEDATVKIERQTRQR